MHIYLFVSLVHANAIYSNYHIIPLGASNSSNKTMQRKNAGHGGGVPSSHDSYLPA
jgi:hypothetical protein